MEQKIPKRRGRKPKIKKPQPLDSKDKENSIENSLEDIRDSNKTDNVITESLNSSSNGKINYIDTQIKDYDDFTLSTGFLDIIFFKFMNSKYAVNIDNGVINKDIGTDIYNKINKNIRLDIVEKNYWNNVTYDAAKKLCKILDYYLTNGPLTDSEVDLLYRTIRLLKSYYIMHIKDFIEYKPFTKVIENAVYIPDKNTSAFKLLTNEFDNILFNAHNIVKKAKKC